MKIFTIVIASVTAVLLAIRALSKFFLKKEEMRFRQIEAEMAAEAAARAESANRIAWAAQLRVSEEEKARRMEEEAARQRITKPERRRPKLPPPQPPKKTMV